MKICTKCKIEKPSSEFHADAKSKDRLYFYCKDCRREYNREWDLKNPGRRAELDRINAAKNPEQYRARRRRDSKNYGIRNPDKLFASSLRRFGLAVEAYQQLLKAQNGVCAICQKLCTIYSRLSVDHDHATGKVRGLLCQACNTSIARMDESPVTLRRAAEYLEKTSCVADEILTQ